MRSGVSRARKRGIDGALYGDGQASRMRQSAARGLHGDREVSSCGIRGGAKNYRGAGARGNAEGTCRIRGDTGGKRAECHPNSAGKTGKGINGNSDGGTLSALRDWKLARWQGPGENNHKPGRGGGFSRKPPTPQPQRATRDVTTHTP